jgi:nitrite reductase/ring-hydroxylating ferredoxin subunit
MNRKEFLRSIGAGAAMALILPCVQGCSGDSGPDGPVNTTGDVDFNIDLTTPEADALQNNGGFIIRPEINNNAGVVVARNLSGEFVAATRTCSHEGNKRVVFQNNEFFCPVHGARFSQQGAGLNSFGSGGLTIYSTELNGNILRVFSS